MSKHFAKLVITNFEHYIFLKKLVITNFVHYI